MLSKLRTGLLAVWALAAAFAPFAVRAEVTPSPEVAAAVKPALWVVRDADSTLYLFGSVHVMKADTPWLTPAIQSRFDSAADVWFEVADLDDTAAALPVAQKYMFDPAGTMTDGLTPQEIAQVEALLKPMGLSTQALKAMRKWAVGLMITMRQVGDLGYAPATGVDVTLLARARQSGQKVHGLETIEQQMQLLAPANAADDVAALRTVLTDTATLPQDIRDLFAAWAHGDDQRLAHLMIDKMQAEDPNGYRRMIVQRNADWTPQIAAILAGKGTTFITVGAGHLVGPDSVIRMLEARGIEVVRVAY